MALPLPPGKIQFCGSTGAPLAGGFVYHYIVGTSTPLDTYQDSAATILNTNPVILDANGEAAIWGTGAYRQVVLDSSLNQQWDATTGIATLASLGGLSLAGGTLTGLLIVPSVQVTGGELITSTPTGDPVTTLSSLAVQATTSSTTVREFAAAIGLVSNKRNGAGGSVTPSIALYSGVQAQAGTSDVWAIRATALLDASSGTYNSFPLETDLNNNVAHRGETVGAAGLSAPTAYGVVASGGGTFRSTAAMLVTGPGTAIWNRGIAFAGNSVAQSTIQDLNSSTISYEIQGTHTTGIDTTAASFSGSAVRLANAQTITGNYLSLDRLLIQQNGANFLLGDPNVSIVSRCHLYPFTDNTYTSGANGNRWASVWAANGTIQTSDPTLKTDMVQLASLPQASMDGLLAAISPIHFKWKDGGGATEDVTETQSVQATEDVTENVETVEMRDGVATLIVTPTVRTQPLFDDVPVLDLAGNPVLVTTEERPAVLDGNGNVITPAMPAQTVPRTFRAPRMVDKQVTVQRIVSKPGKRTHWGWDAAQIRDAFGALGIDFAGYVKGEDGKDYMRPDQMLPVLWEIVARQQARLADLEAKKP